MLDTQLCCVLLVVYSEAGEFKGESCEPHGIPNFVSGSAKLNRGKVVRMTFGPEQPLRMSLHPGRRADGCFRPKQERGAYPAQRLRKKVFPTNSN